MKEPVAVSTRFFNYIFAYLLRYQLTCAILILILLVISSSFSTLFLCFVVHNSRAWCSPLILHSFSTLLCVTAAPGVLFCRKTRSTRRGELDCETTLTSGSAHHTGTLAHGRVPVHHFPSTSLIPLTETDVNLHERRIL